MKKANDIQQTAIQLLFTCTVLLVTSCTNKQKTAVSEVLTTEQVKSQPDRDIRNTDARFLVNAAEINLQHIQLGKLAQLKGKTAHIKKLGQMIETDQKNSLKYLTALAKTKMITLPTSNTNNSGNAYRFLNKKTGNAFDKAYVEMMVSEHKDAIAFFEKSYKSCADINVKNWTTTALAHLRKQLDRSILSLQRVEKLYFDKKYFEPRYIE
ncbi:MAG: DUF4142 domain-containing protein [Bacteroidota bacterium]